MRKTVRYFLKPYTAPLVDKLNEIEEFIEQNRILAAKSLIQKLQASRRYPRKLSEVGFRVFSQWDEDGIIQFLLTRIPIRNRTFIEFGVEDYRESNTRFLLMNDNWRGIVMDSKIENIKSIQARRLYWQHDLTALHAFVTCENINNIILSENVKGDIGLLSIDIDGNDYWLWESIDVISPQIVICEYNSLFGAKDPVSIPYASEFDRSVAHSSHLYFGASLAALCFLAEKKGYIFVGSSQDGSNAFFVRKEVAKKLRPVGCKDGYVESKTRQSKSVLGRLTFVRGDERLKLISDLPVVNVVDKKQKTVGEIIF